jgi:hypothetical protein
VTLEVEQWKERSGWMLGVSVWGSKYVGGGFYRAGRKKLVLASVKLGRRPGGRAGAEVKLAMPGRPRLHLPKQADFYHRGRRW